eukprot:59385-Pleurochrysis_carterae.AAC.1
MASSDATRFMHRRLLIGPPSLRNLPSITADGPPSLAHGTHSGCEARTEANATRQPHSSNKYKASYPGRLIHAGIAGPFFRSHHGSYQYALILVDDHIRFKSVQL